MKRGLLILAVLLLAGVAVLAILGYRKLHRAEAGIPATTVQAQYMQPDDQFVDVAGVRVRVRERGPKNAPVLVLIHGFSMSLESWDKVADILSLDHRVIQYDLLGHGLTGPDPRKRYSPQARADFLGQLLDKLSIQQAAIAGNSLGGVIAWRFAAAHPERVSDLILVDAPVFAFNAVGDKPVSVPMAMQVFLKTVPMAGIDAAVAKNWYDPTKVDAARKQLMHDMMKRAGNGAAMVQSLQQFTMPDPTDLLPRLSMPVLIIWGGADAVVPVANGLKAKAAIPGAAMVTISQAGHLPQEEHPFATAGAISDFLTEHADHE